MKASPAPCDTGRMDGARTERPPELVAATARLIQTWRADSAGTYQTWFLWEERLKNFRSIRRGVETVVAEIREGTFGTQYRGSSLETVVHSVAEQRQIFRGADHAFLWKPKLMREGILRINAEQRNLRSNDFGAIGGLLFDIGSGRYQAPPIEHGDGRVAWDRELGAVREVGRSG